MARAITMKAVAFVAPALVLVLLHLLHRLEVWAQHEPAVGGPRSPRNHEKGPDMADQVRRNQDAETTLPVPHDPPPPPGYVDPLKGSSAENTFTSAPDEEHDNAGPSRR